MKLNGIFGKGSGKVGSSVFAISGGEQIVRQYNPQVSNPNTDAQVAQRAKFKLLSQLAADMASVLVFAKKGLVSARNQFVSKNIGFCTVTDGVANCNLYKLQITPGTVGFPELEIADGTGTQKNLHLRENGSAVADRVVYCIFKKDSENQLTLMESKIVSVAGVSGDFPTTFDGGSDEILVLAYGIKDKNTSAREKFENYELADAQGVAELATSGAISSADYVITKTSAETTNWN